MKKTQKNFYLAVVMFAQVLMLGATAYIMEYQFECGQGRRGGRGLGRQTFLSRGRHDWGDVHSVIALSLLIVLAIHLLLHWNWIKCRIVDLRGDKSTKIECETPQ